jgi:hypothetical protein
MSSRSRRVSLVLALFALQACGDTGGCGGCAEPIPGGFPLDRRVENAGQIRLTPAGIRFIEDNVDTLVAQLAPEGLGFEIPESTSDVAVVGTVTICPGGGCTATIRIVSLDIQTVAPASLMVVAQIEVITSDIRLATQRNAACLWLSGFECDMSLDTRRASPPYNTIQATLVFTIDSRTGYADLDIADAGLADDIQNDDIRIESANTCGAIWCNIANIGFVKDYIIGMLEDQLMGTLEDALASFTCMSCPDAGCPPGTSCGEDGYCVYSDGTCVPILLGLEGQTDLGPMLASVSPGASAPIMFVDAVGGYANVNGNGLNLGLYGGLEAMEPNACVPATYDAPWLTYAPAPQIPEFQSGESFQTCRRCPTGAECGSGYTCSATGRCEDPAGACELVTQTVMVKLALAQRYLDRIGAGLFNAGALCLTVGTAQAAELSSGLLSLLMPAIKVLAWGENAPMAIEVRPQLPPRFELGDAPLITLHLDQAQLDFHLWMLERYVKILTVQMDLTVALDLTVEDGALVPAIGSIAAANVEVTDAMLVGPPANIGELFTDLLELVGGMIPAIDPIALPEFSGFQLEVPDGGVVRVRSGGENFLAIYANLSPATSTPKSTLVTRAALARVDVPAIDRDDAVRLDAILPTAVIGVATPGDGSNRRVEHRWRIDDGPWSRWTRETRLAVRDPRLLLRADPVIEVQARMADDDATMDLDPVRIPIPIDGTPGRLSGEGRRHPTATGAPARGLRGRPEDTGASSGCDCAVPASPNAAGGVLPLLGLGLAAVFLSRRRRHALRIAAAAALAVAFALGGACDCGSGSGTDTPDTLVCNDETCAAPSRCCPASGECVAFPEETGFCPGDTICHDAAGAFAPVFDPDTCSFSTDCCIAPALLPGFVGQFSEVVVADDGEIWVSGYAAGVSERTTYGDLVAGTWDGTAGEVDWEIIDGVPAGTPTADPNGWRGGIELPGDDVGKYTTIALGADGHPRIAYYDATHGALRFASHDGTAWTIAAAPVDDEGDAGRWADMAIGADGRAIVSYNALVESAETEGLFLSQVRVAWADAAAATAWTIHDIAEVPVPCWPAVCGEDRVCVAATRLCTTPDDDDAACGEEGCASGEACIAGACEELFAGPIDFPEGVGIVTGIDLAPDGTPVVVYYDRGELVPTTGSTLVHGDLVQAAYAAGSWGLTVLDGAGFDAGWYPSIDVDAAGQRHLAYVDGIAEDLIYLNPDAGVREVVDGRSRTGRGRTLVGDDSTIRATPDGDVWIAYQNATHGDLLLAHRTGPDAWEVRELDTEDFSGFFAALVLAGPADDEPVVSTYWHRTTARGTTTTRYTYTSGVRVFEVTP